MLFNWVSIDDFVSYDLLCHRNPYRINSIHLPSILFFFCTIVDTILMVKKNGLLNLNPNPNEVASLKFMSYPDLVELYQRQRKHSRKREIGVAGFNTVSR